MVGITKKFHVFVIIAQIGYTFNVHTGLRLEMGPMPSEDKLKGSGHMLQQQTQRCEWLGPHYSLVKDRLHTGESCQCGPRKEMLVLRCPQDRQCEETGSRRRDGILQVKLGEKTQWQGPDQAPQSWSRLSSDIHPKLGRGCSRLEYFSCRRSPTSLMASNAWQKNRQNTVDRNQRDVMHGHQKETNSWGADYIINDTKLKHFCGS